MCKNYISKVSLVWFFFSYQYIGLNQTEKKLNAVIAISTYMLANLGEADALAVLLSLPDARPQRVHIDSSKPGGTGITSY